MPEGQFLGAKKNYLYTTEDNKNIVISTDETLGSIDGTGLVPYTGQPIDGVSFARFNPRIVYWQSNDRTKRKKLICGTNIAALYANGASVALTIDGIAGKTTGRRGEKVSYRAASALLP